MAIFGSFVLCLPIILHTVHGHTTALRWYDCQWPWAYFKIIGLFHIKFLKNAVWYGKSYYSQLIGNHTLAFDWCHFWWPWSPFESHFSLGCHFHVHFSNPRNAFASHGLPAIAELLVFMIMMWQNLWIHNRCVIYATIWSPHSPDAHFHWLLVWKKMPKYARLSAITYLLFYTDH